MSFLAGFNEKAKRIRLYVITSYYLKPIQILYRIRFVFQKKFLHQFERYRNSYLTRANGNEPFSIVKFPYIRSANFDASELTTGNFRFLNRSVELGIPTNWHPSSETKLWIYNLHYFDYVRTIIRLHQAQQKQDGNTGEHYLLFRRLVTEWISSCPVAMPLAWDAYPLSLRLNNWARAYMVFENELAQDTAFSQMLRQSMYIQSIYLEKHLEYHLLNNHLLENGRTLWLMGHFFNGADDDRWRQKGFSILMESLKADFYEDGGHDERSPMYHQIMLDVYQEVFDILVLANEPVPDYVEPRLNDIKNWFVNVLHPDGNLPLFHDCAFDIAGDPADFIDDGLSPANGLTALDASGYFVLRDLDKHHFFMMDCGSMGPDHKNGHGHCGALSFEASIGGQRFIVDSGVNDYNSDIEWRDYFRSTRAHNTVVIDGCEQSEIWERFRIAQRYATKDVVSSESEFLSFVAASHTGYKRLPGNVSHRRWMCYVDHKFWVICDLIDGTGTHLIESLLHFHPAVQIAEYGVPTDFGHKAKVTRDNIPLQVLSWGASSINHYQGRLSPIQGFYAPRFGECVENTVLGFENNKPLPAWLGYVLLPTDTEAELEFISTGQSGQLNVKSNDTRYHLTFNHDGVELDIL